MSTKESTFKELISEFCKSGMTEFKYSVLLEKGSELGLNKSEIDLDDRSTMYS